MESKSIATDFFLTLGLTTTLYLVITAFLRIVFAIINFYYPPQANYYFNLGVSTISLPLAGLIILFPVYLGLSYFNHRLLIKDRARLNLGIRKWLSYLTLFIASAVIIGDLVYILYAYLDGQDLSTAFLLKSLTVIITAIVVISYYYQSQKTLLGAKQNYVYIAISGLLVILAIGSGFATFGSPRYQRLSRFDNVRSQNLAQINSLVMEYWRNTAKLPDTLNQLSQSQAYSFIPTDPETKAAYVYQKTGNLTYQLCANFATSVIESKTKATYPADEQKFYSHGSGKTCFDYSINPQLIPANPKPVTY